MANEIIFKTPKHPENFLVKKQVHGGDPPRKVSLPVGN